MWLVHRDPDLDRSGEGYFRLTAFGTYENTLAAMERIQTL